MDGLPDDNQTLHWTGEPPNPEYFREQRAQFTTINTGPPPFNWAAAERHIAEIEARWRTNPPILYQRATVVDSPVCQPEPAPAYATKEGDLPY
jgi:hypothetical protein